MATDLMGNLDNTYDSNWGSNAMRQSKWQNSIQSNDNSFNSTLEPFDENNPFGAGDDNTTNINNINNNFNAHTSLKIDDIDEEFLKIRDELRNEISGIINNANAVKKICGQYKLAATQEHSSLMKQVDTLMQQNTALTTHIKHRVHDEKLKLRKTCKSVDSLKIKEFNNLVADFKQSCTVFSQSLTQFDKTVKGEQIRQLDVVDVDNTLTQSDKDKLLSSDDFGAVQKFIDQKYALTDSSNEQLIERLTNLEETHDGLKRIERSVRELRDLFNELNILVIEQQDLIDSIEQNVIETRDNVQSGTKHLEKAEKHQKNSRKMMLYATICCIIILLIIIIAVAV